MVKDTEQLVVILWGAEEWTCGQLPHVHLLRATKFMAKDTHYNCATN